jgi:hypothetical protein
MAESEGIKLIDLENGESATSSFSALVVEGSNTFTTTTSSALHGTRGVLVTFDGTNNDSYGYWGFTSVASIYARASFQFNDFNGDAGNLFFSGLRSATGTTNRLYFRAVISAGVITINRVYYYDDAGAKYVACSKVVTQGVKHYGELHHRNASSADANDGIAEFFWDGELITSTASILNVDNYTIPIQRFAVGNFGTIIPTSVGTIYIDDIKLSDSYIGPYDGNYVTSGTIELSGAAITSKTEAGGSAFSFIGSGEVVLSGAAITSYEGTGTNFSYTGLGAINISGVSHTKGYTLIIDHTYVSKYSTIPQSVIDKIKKYRMCIAGESHSLGHRTGLQLVENLDAKFAVNITESGTPELGSVTSYIRSDRLTWGDYDTPTGFIADHGEEDDFTNVAGIAQVKTGLKYLQDNNYGFTVFGFGWCWDQSDGTATASISSIYKCAWYGSTVAGGDGDKAFGLTSADYSETLNHVSMQNYLDATREYIIYAKANATSVTVIFTTGPIDAHEGERGYQRHLKKEMIRNEVLTNGGILLDDGDVLAYDNAGNENILTWTDTESGTHDYQQIADDNLLDLDGVNRSATTGYHIGERGATRLGKAQWVLAAYIVGWDGTPEGTYVGSGNIELSGSAITKETNNYSYNGNGLINLSGIGITKETNNYSNIGSGLIEIVGASPTSYTDEVAYFYLGNGTININGLADTKEVNYYVYSGNGEIIISGSAITEENLNNYTYIGSGSFIISGSAITSSNTGEIVAGHWSIALSSRSPSISLSSRAPSITLGGK